MLPSWACQERARFRTFWRLMVVSRGLNPVWPALKWNCGQSTVPVGVAEPGAAKMARVSVATATPRVRMAFMATPLIDQLIGPLLLIRPRRESGCSILHPFQLAGDASAE